MHLRPSTLADVGFGYPFVGVLPISPGGRFILRLNLMGTERASLPTGLGRLLQGIVLRSTLVLALQRRQSGNLLFIPIVSSAAFDALLPLTKVAPAVAISSRQPRPVDGQSRSASERAPVICISTFPASGLDLKRLQTAYTSTVAVVITQSCAHHRRLQPPAIMPEIPPGHFCQWVPSSLSRHQHHRRRSVTPRLPVIWRFRMPVVSLAGTPSRGWVGASFALFM